MKLEDANTKLDRVKIRQKGSRLYLRATLPPKEGHGRPKQYEIRTGCPATEAGYKAALGKAQRLESELIFEKFQWENWTQNDVNIPSQRNIEQWIEAFEQSYWQEREKTDSRAGAFQRDYLVHFRYLPLDESLTIAVLERVLLQTPPDSRTRKACHGAFTRLANYAKLELPPNWVRLRGKYKPKTGRKIPTDSEILATWESLKGQWQWVYGIMAAYGIRNHEIMHLSFEDYPAIRIGDETKTGTRISYPLHPNWAERFNCQQIKLPHITATDNRQIGSAVGKAFKRLGVGHVPYSLRDAYAIRASTLGISPAIVSKWLGHSLAVHYQHYLKYIEKSDFDNVWQGLSH